MSTPIGRAKAAAKLRFPRTYEAIKAANPATWRRRRHLAGRSADDIFTEFYETDAWQSPESKSGTGSTLAATAAIRAALPSLLSDLDIKTLIDAPCGDFHWMRHVDLPLRRYIGGDIVAPLIDRLNAEYGDNIRSFMVLDLTTDPLPEADALFCRDLFLHLPFADIERVKANFLASRCKYLIASTTPAIKVQFDIVTGEARPVNLTRPPLHWPQPLRLLDDRADGYPHRRMGVWRRDQF